MIYFKIKYLFWRIFSGLMWLQCFSEFAYAQGGPIELYLLIASLVTSVGSGAAATVGGYFAGKAQEAQLAYQKEQDRWNRNRTKRIDASNFRQALFTNKIALRQTALAEASFAFQKKRAVIADTTSILDWFDGFLERKRQKRVARAVGEFGIIPVSPLSGGQRTQITQTTGQ